jgi:hypothetical protein
MLVNLYICSREKNRVLNLVTLIMGVTGLCRIRQQLLSY